VSKYNWRKHRNKTNDFVTKDYVDRNVSVQVRGLSYGDMQVDSELPYGYCYVNSTDGRMYIWTGEWTQVSTGSTTSGWSYDG
jgi:hypothetical protein